jgi:hypothetical protein
MKPNVPWVHRSDDGRGPREVYLNGELIGRVLYADERRGFVHVHEEGKPLVHITLRGKVEVRPVTRGRAGQ